jgi:hypothetical protein
MFTKFVINWDLVFKALVRLFEFCGFSPINISGNRKPNKSFDPWDIFLVLLSFVHLAMATFCVFLGYKDFFATDSESSNFNNILKFSMIALTYIVAEAESRSGIASERSTK